MSKETNELFNGYHYAYRLIDILKEYNVAIPTKCRMKIKSLLLKVEDALEQAENDREVIKAMSRQSDEDTVKYKKDVAKDIADALSCVYFVANAQKEKPYSSGATEVLKMAIDKLIKVPMVRDYIKETRNQKDCEK